MWIKDETSVFVSHSIHSVIHSLNSLSGSFFLLVSPSSLFLFLFLLFPFSFSHFPFLPSLSLSLSLSFSFLPPSLSSSSRCCTSCPWFFLAASSIVQFCSVLSQSTRVWFFSSFPFACLSFFFLSAPATSDATAAASATGECTVRLVCASFLPAYVIEQQWYAEARGRDRTSDERRKERRVTLLYEQAIDEFT